MEIVRYLVEKHKVNPFEFAKKSKFNAFHFAKNCGQPQVLSYLKSLKEYESWMSKEMQSKSADCSERKGPKNDDKKVSRLHRNEIAEEDMKLKRKSSKDIAKDDEIRKKKNNHLVLATPAREMKTKVKVIKSESVTKVNMPAEQNRKAPLPSNREVRLRDLIENIKKSVAKLRLIVGLCKDSDDEDEHVDPNLISEAERLLHLLS